MEIKKSRQSLVYSQLSYQCVETVGRQKLEEVQCCR